MVSYKVNEATALANVGKYSAEVGIGMAQAHSLSVPANANPTGHATCRFVAVSTNHILTTRSLIMSILHIPAILALAMAFTVPCDLQASAASEPNPIPAPKPIINTVCPMDGNPIDKNTTHTCPMTVGEGADAKHYRVAMCSMACATEFKKDPEKVLKPMNGKNAAGPKTDSK